MGYRSDVVLMAVLDSAEQCDEVMAAYRMLPATQEHKLEADWRRVDRINGMVALIYEGRDVKWYDGYEDVQGMYALKDLLHTFSNERGFEFAWAEVRIGEETHDIVEEDTYSGNSDHLRELIWDSLRVVRAVEVDI